MKRRKKKIGIFPILTVIMAGVYLIYNQGVDTKSIEEFIEENNTTSITTTIVTTEESSLNSLTLESIPEYDGVNKYVVINNNEPSFLSDDLVTRSYEFYSDLDSLGRAGVAMASIGVDLMPTEERGSIGNVKPSGWHTIKYDFISGKYLYNRCHLIGYQLTGENANEKNLITCTRSTNVGVMLDYENKVAEYIKNTNNHVLYRVTPIYDGDNLLASGIHMEGYSVEDNGEGIKFNIYIYNVEDGVDIDYSTGDSQAV